MTAHYNEIEPYAAAWTRNLITAGHVAPGVVDERSITDLSATDVSGPGQRHFFAGIGGWSYALRLAGVPDAEAGLRELRKSAPETPRSSLGRGREQQHAGQSPDAMSVVSQAVARAIQKSWVMPFPLASGIPNRVGRLRAYGNAIVPQVAATFIVAALDAIFDGGRR